MKRAEEYRLSKYTGSMRKCRGIIGILFGHRYRSVYDVDTIYRSAAEIEKISAAATNYNFYTFPSTNQISGESIAQPKQVTKVLVGRMCSRCGDFIKDAPLTV